MKSLAVMFRSILAIGVLGLLIAVGGAVYIYHVFGANVPDPDELKEYAPPMVTRVHAGDGRMLAEYAIENRVFVPIEAIPELVKDAFLAAEDKSFYDHPGLDIRGIVRAAWSNIDRYRKGQRPEGASTITQQVAKNFFLTSEVSVRRKIEEAILAFRIESTLSKDEILELYLNEIYLGQGTYGVMSASQNYFSKPLTALTVEEAAFLAALPKAPGNYDPRTYKDEAVARRNWVLSRMAADGRISREEAETAMQRDLVTRPREEAQKAVADYFTEDVRRQIQSIYGNSALYEGGLVVHSTLDPHLQEIADDALRRGLIRYDRRHGWRGPVARFVASEAEFQAMQQQRAEAKEAKVRALRRGQAEGWRALPPEPILAAEADWPAALAQVEPPPMPPIKLLAGWTLAVVLDPENGRGEAAIALADGRRGVIPRPEVAWARPWRPNQSVGGQPSRPADILDKGDIVLVEHVSESPSGGAYSDPNNYALRQIPDVEGALVAMDPHTGRVMAMTGGWSFAESEFNRASQAQRQPGSSFKPVVYLTALENGFTPASIIHDAPIEISQGSGKPSWKPKNYSGRYYGPTPLRVGVEKSRNLMTVRLAQKVGMQAIAETARKLGVDENLQPVLSSALGADETTLLKMVTGYSMIVNGGKKIEPTLVDRIQDRYGEVVYRHDQRHCDHCSGLDWAGQKPPVLADTRERVADPISAYQMVSILQGVIQRGTGAGRADIGRPAGGKTGTTNDNFDVWFIGFTPDLVAGVFVGFDQPRTLGRKDTGSTVAAPIFRDFMKAATEGQPAKDFVAPPETLFISVSRTTGQRATGDGTIQEAFKPGTGPDAYAGSVTTYTPTATDTTTLGVPGLY